MPRPPVFEGNRLQIVYLELGGDTCPAAEFLESLDRKERKKFDVLFELLGQTGQIRNAEQFKKVEGSDGLFEFKRHQIRLFCYFTSDRRVVLLCGVRKKKDKLTPADIARAQRYKTLSEESCHHG